MDQRVCERCGESFRSAGVGRPARYCSRSCRQRAYETNRALRELGKVDRPGAGPGAAPDNVSDETSSVTDETRPGAVTSPELSTLPPPKPEFLAELGLTAAQFDTWRRKELMRPPLVWPFDDDDADGTAGR